MLFATVGCSPMYDWREVRGENAPFTVTLPAKPARVSRPVDLNGTAVTMTMTASEVDGVTYAVGTAELPDSMQAQVSLAAMKKAMVSNIRGAIKQQKVFTMGQSQGAEGKVAVTEIEVTGQMPSGEARLLFARFVAREKRVYQVIVVGPGKAVNREAVDTFFSSFRLH